MKLRGHRRNRSWRKARKAQRQHLRLVPPSGLVDCRCELSMWMFEKRKSLGCTCGKKKFGQPKVTVGIEYGPSKVLAARRHWRGESFRGRGGVGDGDGSSYRITRDDTGESPRPCSAAAQPPRRGSFQIMTRE